MVRLLVQKKFLFTETLRICALFLSFLCLNSNLSASQWGPVFPSHRYPTDRSYHVNSWFSYGSQDSVFDGKGEREQLDGSLSRFRVVINPEYQPTRELSLGAYLNFDSLKLSESGQTLSKSGFSDQFIFGEYRVVDEPGHSIGFATIFKIPFYSVPGEVNSTSEDFLLLGDGQIDSSLLLTTEYWAWRSIKLIGDIGITYRTDEHATELPFQLGAQYVSPKYNFGFYVLGNLSFKNDKATQNTTSQQIQNLTGSTGYVFANSPETIIFGLKGEYALNPSWAFIGDLQNSVWGKSSPYFINFSAGVSYRFFDPSTTQRSAREVGIETDDATQEFEGEIQEAVPQDQEIQAEDENF